MNITNLILLAVLTNCSDFSKKLNLPLCLPLTPQHVKKMFVHQLNPSVIVFLTLTNGFKFQSCDGHIISYDDPKSFSVRFPTRSELGQKQMMNKDDAIIFAKDCVTKLGYDPDFFYMNLDPGFNDDMLKYAHCNFTWFYPNSESTPTISFEIDLHQKRLLHMTALALIGNRDRLLNIPSLEEFLTSDHKRQNEIYYNDSRKPKPEEVLAILPIIKQFSSSLSIPTNWPNSMDGVKAAEFSLEKGSSELYIKITNGYCYSYDAQAKRVTGFVRNDCFFFADNRQHLDLKSITGAPRLNEQMAIAMVTNAIAKLGLGPKSASEKGNWGCFGRV